MAKLKYKANIVITEEEKVRVREEQRIFNDGQYKSEEHYFTSLRHILGLDFTAPDWVGLLLKKSTEVRIYIYPEFPTENCLISKGVVEKLKRRK